MSTSYETPDTQSGAALPGVAVRLSALRTQIKLWFVLEGLAYVFWAALALGAISFLLDYYFRLQLDQRTFLLVACVIVLLVVFAQRVLRPLGTPLTDDGLILEVERRHPELAEALISAVQFKRLGGKINPHTSLAMVEATINRGSEAAQLVRFGDVINRSGFGQNFILLLAALAVVGGLAYGGTVEPHIAAWFKRNVLLQSTPYPQNTYLKILRAENGKIRIPKGDDYTLEVIVTNDSKIVPERVFIDFRDGRAPLAMKLREPNTNPDSKATYETVLANVIQSFRFSARGGDERGTEYVEVELVDPPALDKLELAVTYPSYAGGQTEILPAGKGPYFILPGSTLKLTGVGNKPLAQAALAREGERVELKIADGKNVSGELTAAQLKTGQYAIELTDSEGLTARRPATFGLRLRPDREPKVRAKLVGIGGMVTARARLPLEIRVSDDYGLTEVYVPFVWRGDDEQRKEGSGKLPLPEAKIEPKKLDLSFKDVLDLEPLDIPTSTGLTFHVAAADNDDYPDDPAKPAGPNIGKSPDFTIRVVTDEELRSDLLRREKEQRQEFERLATQQLELLTFSRELAAQLASQDLNNEQKLKLSQTPKQQKLIGTNANSVTQRLSSIVVEIANNRLEEKDEKESSSDPSDAESEADADKIKKSIGKRLKSKIVQPLIKLQEEGFPAAVQMVEQARRATGDAAAKLPAVEQLVKQQEEVHTQMLEILSEMAQAEGFQEVVNALYEVEKQQKEIAERTRKANEEKQKGIIEGSGTSKPKEKVPDEPGGAPIRDK
jgi:hypothetical protein